jgi:hypothetical protein
MRETDRKNMRKMTLSPKIRLRYLMIFVVVLLLIGGLSGYYYRYHLYWKYIEWYLNKENIEDIEKIPNRVIISEISVPENWTEHVWKGVSFRLPPDMSLDNRKTNNTIIFCSDNLRVIIMVYPPTSEFLSFCDIASQMSLTRDSHLTLPQLRLKCFSVGKNDFHWSMSPKEVRWHCFAVCMRPILDYCHPNTIESIFRDDWNGILLLNEDKATFEWQCISGNGGYFHFSTEEGQLLDIETIRRICQSIKIDCGTALVQ